jgi:hypothetical protein
MFGQRDYVLPAEVHTNLPRQGYDGEPGGWNRARGLLMELAWALGATPEALYHRPLETPEGNPDGVVVTAIVKDSRHSITTVVFRRQEHQPGNRQRRPWWQLTVNGTTPPQGTGHVSPAPPWLARIATTAADHQPAHPA